MKASREELAAMGKARVEDAAERIEATEESKVPNPSDRVERPEVWMPPLHCAMRDECRVRAAAEEAEATGHSAQHDVAAFFAAIDLPIGETPAIRNPQVNADLILEEARETAEAITGRRVTIEFDDDQSAERGQCLVDAIDGLCDLLATIYGAAVTFGIDLGPFWDEVHRTNMAKAGGPKRADGKQLKPEGWTPPALAPILAEQEGRHRG